MLLDNADVLAAGSTPQRPDSPPPKRSTRGRPWQRVFAVIGIIAALVSIVLIIPGLFGIRSYGRWRRGEGDTPVLLISWGVLLARRCCI
jgi:hypothetical protein